MPAEAPPFDLHGAGRSTGSESHIFCVRPDEILLRGRRGVLIVEINQGLILTRAQGRSAEELIRPSHTLFAEQSVPSTPRVARRDPALMRRPDRRDGQETTATRRQPLRTRLKPKQIGHRDPKSIPRLLGVSRGSPSLFLPVIKILQKLKSRCAAGLFGILGQWKTGATGEHSGRRLRDQSVGLW